MSRESFSDMPPWKLTEVEEDEHAADVEWEKLHGAGARRASYRETLARL